MSKLFRLRQWLTVSEAAKHMSISFGEEVTEADVLRAALDDHLRLSVNFVNHASARCGKPTAIEDAEWDEIPAELVATLPGVPDGVKGKPFRYMKGLDIGGGRCLNLSDDVVTVQGTWDLPMIGAERLDIEHRFQMLTGGPAVTLCNLEGPFVEGSDGTLCQLQEDFDLNEYQPGSRAALEALQCQIRDKRLEPDEARALLDRHREQREEFLERRKSRPTKENFYPAGALPEDAVLVVRTESLRDFERHVDESAQAPDRRSVPRDNSLIATIAALLAVWPGGAPPSGKDLERAAHSLGLNISDDTIRKALKAAHELAPSLPLPK